MRYVIFCMVFFLAIVAFAQQRQLPSTTTPPEETRPPIPEQRQTPEQQMPPETQAPPGRAASNERAEKQIMDRLKAEPGLSSTNVDVRVDDNSVVLTGSVDTITQHDLAIRIAQANGGGRRIVDKININQTT